jgi:hypothetical protein
MLQSSVLMLGALLFSFASLKLFFVPYVWICLSWVVVCLYVTMHARSTLTEVVAVSLAAVLLVWGSFEGFLYAQAGEVRRDEIRNQDGEIVIKTMEHEILGWAPVKSQVVDWRRYYGNTLLFDVTHTVDDNGLRISPESTAPECLLFFGGSFIFGAGVNDEETMPYLVGSRYRESFRTYDFGYSGYGAHQMLATLQHGIVDNTIECEPKYAIYLGMSDYPRRSSGKALWAVRGPMYERSDEGDAVYNGQLQNRSNFFSESPGKYLVKSLIIRMLLEQYHVTSDDVELHVAIVDASKNLIEERYAGSEFHVIIWDDESRISREILALLKEKGIRVHLVSEILPNFFSKHLDYVLSEDDGHPNRRAHKAIAEYVSENIVQK